MPYLKEDDKEKFDVYYDESRHYLSELSLGEFAGHLNYMVYKTVKTWIRKNGKRYFHFATIVGTLVCCVLEIYRRQVAGYEDEKIKENGDVD